MIDYKEKIRELRFNFRPEEAIDYQTLLALAGTLIADETQYNEYKEELFHTVQILVLVYGLEDQVQSSYYNFDIKNIDINDLNLWKYLMVELYEDLVKTSDFLISDNMKNKLFTVLNILEEKTSTFNQSTFENNCDEPKCNDQPNNDCEPKFDEGEYNFVEPNFNFENSHVEEVEETPSKLDFNNCDNDLNSLNPCYLRDYIIAYKLLPYKCDNCGISEWQGKILPLKLTSKVPYLPTQSLDNFKFLCPNCYSQIGKE